MFVITSGENKFEDKHLAESTTLSAAFYLAYKKSKIFGTVNLLQDGKCIGGFCYGMPR